MIVLQNPGIFHLLQDRWAGLLRLLLCVAIQLKLLLLIIINILNVQATKVFILTKIYAFIWQQKRNHSPSLSLDLRFPFRQSYMDFFGAGVVAQEQLWLHPLQPHPHVPPPAFFCLSMDLTISETITINTISITAVAIFINSPLPYSKIRLINPASDKNIHSILNHCKWLGITNLYYRLALPNQNVNSVHRQSRAKIPLTLNLH